MRNSPRYERAYGRRLLEGLSCDLGQVVDMSRGGMRITSRNRVKKDEELDLTLESLEDTVELRGRVRWVEKTGFRRYEFGLQFLDVTEDLAARLVKIATVHQVSKVLEY